MRILVTNDDGIEAPGLHALASALVADGHTIEIAAPQFDCSGSGTAVGTLDDGAEIAYQDWQLPGLPGVRAIGIDAPPAFAVLAFCTGVFGPAPDVVLSGINAGHNTGRLILSSSTVGAALTASALGVRGAAFSSGFPPGHRFDTASEIAVGTVRWLIEHSPPGTALNVNIPDLAVADLKGVRLAPLANRGLMGLDLQREEKSIRLKRFDNTERLGVGTDSALVDAGFVAVSVLSNVGTERNESATSLISAIEGRAAASVP